MRGERILVTGLVALGAIAGCGGDGDRPARTSAPAAALPTPVPVTAKAGGCDLLTADEVSHFLDVPVPTPEDDSFVPDVPDAAALPPLLSCGYVDDSTGLVVLAARVEALEFGMGSTAQTLEIAMTGHDTFEDVTVSGHPGGYGPPVQEGGMPKLVVVAPDDRWVRVVSLTADSPAADRDTLVTLAERLLIRLGL